MLSTLFQSKEKENEEATETSDPEKGGKGELGVIDDESDALGPSMKEIATPTVAILADEPAKPSTRLSLRTAWKVIRSRPHVTLWTLTCLILLLVPSMVGLFIARDNEIVSQKVKAYEGAAQETANGIAQKMENIFLGVKSMVSYIRVHPNCSELDKSFSNMSWDIRNFDGRNDIFQLEADISGVITYIEPDLPHELNWLYGYDILSNAPDKNKQRDLMRSPGYLAFDGPRWQPDGFNGGYAIYSIFLPAESADQDMGCGIEPNSAYLNVYWDHVRKMKFWGFVQGMVNVQSLYDGTDYALKGIKEAYHFRIKVADVVPVNDPNTELTGNIIYETFPTPKQAISRDIRIENIHWVIELSPKSGWTPNWFAGCIAAVSFGSVVISLLMMWLLVVMEIQKMVNDDLAESMNKLAETTDKLQEEKHATDELVKRQLKLIGCLEGPKRENIGDSTSSLDKGLKDRIASVRLQVQQSGTVDGKREDEISMIELLGEGSFGKVYKGLWRDSVVAVKSIILPANMSGAAKREKMAVMEAAISSTLSHPNIVQTYTYDVTKHHDSSMSNVVRICSSTDLNGSKGASLNDSSAGAYEHGVHSLEVRIVLEYCDLGSLKEYLMKGLFKDETGRTIYMHVLDTVADISRAMSHLHRANVLHGDLKSVNVLLKSNGSEGRGFCAKVADFGLSVQMDGAATHMSNVFQGTITHMSPELLLKGYVSRQTDVYAFGITMWELMTAACPYEGVPAVTLGHGVAKKRWRPKWPANVPLDYRLLAEDCWSQKPEDRPSFEKVIGRIGAIRRDFDPTVDQSSFGSPKGKKDGEPDSLAIGDMMESMSCGASLFKVPEDDEAAMGAEVKSELKSTSVVSLFNNNSMTSNSPAAPSVMSSLRPGYAKNTNKHVPPVRGAGSSAASIDVHSVMRSLGSGRLDKLLEVDEEEEQEEEEEDVEKKLRKGLGR